MTATPDAPVIVEPPYGDQPADTADQINAIGRMFATVPTPTLFELHRDVDATGVSGPGRVAAGVIFPFDGGAVYEWQPVAPPPGYDRLVRQFGAYDSIAEVLAVHGHQGSTVLRTIDATDVDGLQLSGDLDRQMPEAFAVVDVTSDVPEWGAWFPGRDRAVTWAPPITPVSGRRQAGRLTHWRSIGDMIERVAVRTGPGQGRLVWLTQHAGRRLVREVRGAYTSGVKHTRQAAEQALTAFDATPAAAPPRLITP